MGQQRVSNIALIHTERAYANFVLENDIERIIDIFGSRTGRDLFLLVWLNSLTRRAGFKGADRGPGPQASHQQRASHQTRHILFVVHASCSTKLTHSLIPENWR